MTDRAAEPADLPLILRAERDYIEAVEPDQLTAWTESLDRNLALWIANLSRTTMTQRDGEVAGYVMWTVADDAALVITIGVLPQHRRHGLGAHLLDVVAAQAAAEGLQRITLGVHERNPARSIYERAGYVRCGRDADYLLYERVLG